MKVETVRREPTPPPIVEVVVTFSREEAEYFIDYLRVSSRTASQFRDVLILALRD